MRENTVNYVSDVTGTIKNYIAVNEAICEMRRLSDKKKLSASWRNGIDEDYARRRKENN